MAELTESSDDAVTSTCCPPEQRADCCAPSAKAQCCPPGANGCGCQTDRKS